jgi:DNA polymerase III subunit beta
VKIQVDRDALADAVAWTARALPARPAIPVLACMRLHAGEDLTLSSFDYDVSAQASVPVVAEEEGTVLVSGRLLAEITRSLPARPVEISADGTRATLTCGSATFTLLTMPVEDYPTLPDMPPAAGSVVRHRGRTRRHPARSHRCPHRDRERHPHAGIHRPVPAGDP